MTPHSFQSLMALHLARRFRDMGNLAEYTKILGFIVPGGIVVSVSLPRVQSRLLHPLRHYIRFARWRCIMGLHIYFLSLVGTFSWLPDDVFN